MGTDTLLDTHVGRCSKCNIPYVTYAEIRAYDSHARIRENYGCPKCKENHPKDVKVAKEDSLLSFAYKQLDKRLKREKHNGLELLTSQTN